MHYTMDENMEMARNATAILVLALFDCGITSGVRRKSMYIPP